MSDIVRGDIRVLNVVGGSERVGRAVRTCPHCLCVSIVGSGSAHVWGARQGVWGQAPVWVLLLAAAALLHCSSGNRDNNNNVVIIVYSACHFPVGVHR
jgi:hypothetical protein